jgi:hypothetical protein
MSGGFPTSATSTHAPRPAKRVSTSYQKSRVNVFINPAHKHQLDALSAEWGVPLVEAFRRVLNLGLQSIMHGGTISAPVFPLGAAP